MKTPQELGRDWENEWKKTIDGQLQPNSGATAHNKLDVRSKRITWSNKLTTTGTFNLTKALINEANAATVAPGGNGTIPAFAIRIVGVGDFVLLQSDDFLELLYEEPILQPDKASIKRKLASVPDLLKE